MAAPRSTAYIEIMRLPIRLAIVGAARGANFIKSAALHDQIELVAVCDRNPAALAKLRDAASLRCYSDYGQVLEDDGIDAVLIATPLKLHAPQAIAALAAGKHVLCEVTAAFTLDESWALVEAVEKSGLTYMLAENYCFRRDVMMVGEMVRQGVFGEIIYAEGSYIHDCRDIAFTEAGELNWRGLQRRDDFCNCYPTHSLGPVCQWLGINRTDHLATTATWHSNALAMHDYVDHVRGRDNVAEPDAPWRLPDTVTTMIRTRRGTLIEHRFDASSPRPHHMDRYALQGTRASYTSNITPEGEPLVWIMGRSPAHKNGLARSWEPLYSYADEFEHPWWRGARDAAAKAGHGGGDYFVLREFADAIVEGRPPAIDVYDAVTWSCITPLSEVSMRNNNVAIDVPDFRTRRDTGGSRR